MAKSLNIVTRTASKIIIKVGEAEKVLTEEECMMLFHIIRKLEAHDKGGVTYK